MADDKLNQCTSRDGENDDNVLRKVAFSSLGCREVGKEQNELNVTNFNGSPTGSISPLD